MSAAGDLDLEAIKALLALSRAVSFELLPDGGTAANQPEGWRFRLRGEALAALEARALIKLGDDAPDGTPRRITVTAWGASWLKRWLAGHNARMVRTAPAPEDR